MYKDSARLGDIKLFGFLQEVNLQSYGWLIASHSEPPSSYDISRAFKCFLFVRYFRIYLFPREYEKWRSTSERQHVCKFTKWEKGFLLMISQIRRDISLEHEALQSFAQSADYDDVRACAWWNGERRKSNPITEMLRKTNPKHSEFAFDLFGFLVERTLSKHWANMSITIDMQMKFILLLAFLLLPQIDTAGSVHGFSPVFYLRANLCPISSRMFFAFCLFTRVGTASKAHTKFVSWLKVAVFMCHWKL